MYRIPLTQSVIVTGSERQDIANDFAAAAVALEESAALNMSLLKDFMAAEAKVRELSLLLVSQAEATGQIMQINESLSGALGRIRQGEDIEDVILGLEAQLAEFGPSVDEVFGDEDASQ